MPIYARCFPTWRDEVLVTLPCEPHINFARTTANYGPIMVHESLPTATKYAYGSHPRPVFSISYLLTGFFHGGNAIHLALKTRRSSNLGAIRVQPDFLKITLGAKWGDPRRYFSSNYH